MFFLHPTRRSWIRELFAACKPRTIRKAPARRRLAVEQLESRVVPSTFKFVTGDTDGTIYGVDTAGALHWYKVTDRDDSSGAFGVAHEGSVIGTGWNNFTHV